MECDGCGAKYESECVCAETPCEKCGHLCPRDAECGKCGGDPMLSGDRLCVDCDAEERDADVE